MNDPEAMCFDDQPIIVPNLWIGWRAFGTRGPEVGRCGTMTPACPEVERALREARHAQRTVTPAETDEQARAELKAYVIVPAFFDGQPEDLAAEYLRAVLHLDPAEEVLVWLRYTQAAAVLLGREALLPVPVMNPPGD